MEKHLYAMWSVITAFLVKSFTWDAHQRSKIYDKISEVDKKVDENDKTLRADMAIEDKDIYKTLANNYMPRKECEAQQQKLEERHQNIMREFADLKELIKHMK